MVDLDPGQLEALSTAVTEGTFDGAARVLHVTPSAISQRIKALENTVGRVLVVRSKPVTATPAGEALVRLATQIKALSADVARELGADAAAVVIPLAVNADSLSTWVLPALATVGPPLVFDLHRADEARTADLLRAGVVMAAVTSSDQAVPGCTVERLGRMRYRPTASSAFMARWFPEGVTPAALALAPVVVFDRNDLMQDRYLRRRTRRQVDPPRHYVPGSADFVQAVRLGLGWGMLPDLQTAVVRGRSDLVELDPRGRHDVHLYWQQWRLTSAALDRVADAVRAAAAAVLAQPTNDLR